MSTANNIQPRLTTTQDPITAKQLVLPMRIIAVIAAVVAIITTVTYLAGGLGWRAQAFPGFMMSYTLVVDGNQTFGAETWAGQEAGLQRLDRITQVNETGLSSSDYAAARAGFRQVFDGLSTGDEVTLQFLRPANRASASADICNPAEEASGFVPCEVRYNLAPMPTSDYLTLFVFPFVTALVALAVGVTLLVYRSGDILSLWISIFCFSLGVFSGGLFNNGSTHILMPIWLGFTTLGATSALIIALTFPSRLPITQRQPVLLATPIVVGVGLLAIDLYVFANPASPYQFALVWQLPTYFAVLSFLTLSATLVMRRRRVTSSVYRDQINTSLIGIGLALIPVMLWVISNVALTFDASQALPFNSATTMPFLISIPIGMAYTMLQYRDFDTDRVLSQGVTYGIMLGALVIGYFFMVSGVKLLTQNFIQSDNPFIIAFTIFVIAVAFLPIRTRLQQRIDAIYFRERRNFQTLAERFGRKIATSRDFNDILQQYMAYVQDPLNPKGTFIFLPGEESGHYTPHRASIPSTDIRFEGYSTMLTYLNQVEEPIRIETGSRWHPSLVTEKTRLNILQANVIIPLRAGRDMLSGFVVLAIPEVNRGQYTYEEIRYLENISSQMAVAVERSQVVESLERRVRELGVLSQVSQAVNFAVEFDDLLELISAQTQKVLEAPNFYIALRDAGASQMYYAFFMEYNERLRENEDRRWVAGGDIYSTIIEDEQATRLDNYSNAINNRQLDARAISKDMRAWMGVPLIAGQTRLGVIAIGTTRADYTYSDEQLRIFNDLGALAATSLDKARLFEEANVRARQLRALNDIARQLQSERKVERLIPLITSSAVDILNAEAGSLLLQAEDGSGDMEFRIVIGGSGQDLVGTRVKKGHGIVGEVIETGNPIIVNDTTQDSRWQGEIANSENFQTSSVLAVPLMANNEVIGVLEVLNKKDGSAYRKDDADVLETFAGQAAIAIDNAQLFQKTDEQLSLRVQELETLEKIDVELNRALDLQRIAEITVRWAVANSGASGAILGLLIEDSPATHMRILHSYGYQDEDMPASRDGDLLPLDEGIVSRVMRTKQADIQPDVSIDPDYVPSLRDAKSQITVPILAGDEIIAILILEKNYNPSLNLIDLAFVQRLTEHAAIAIENARLYNELESTNKAQSRYMGVGAHELKNALAPIKGWTDFLMSGVLGEVSDQQENSLRVIKNNVGRAELIIQDLRDFAKMRAQELRIEPEPTSIRNIVIETLRPFTQQIEEKDQTLVNHIINKKLPNIMGDSQRLIQVMTNFVSNANKYSPEGATITLDATVDSDRRNKNNQPLPDALVVSIADTGMGISEEDQKKMFTPYFRTKQAEESEIPGTGLGMSLTKEIIVQHNGEVWIESELGVGSTFYFSVPLAAEEQETETATEPASD